MLRKMPGEWVIEGLSLWVGFAVKLTYWGLAWLAMTVPWGL